ncbi:Cell-division-associated, ABC-transporter-like signaling protein FtsX [hydrothermal vent metagenome]|uniref:Cell division protein FtsX n=1 Tax=hydrothermal vent metagenome TaxID=652676 RepID=A0A3B1A9W5_9ZZZZ
MARQATRRSPRRSATRVTPSGASPKRGASTVRRPGGKGWLRGYFKGHFQALFLSLGRVSRNPLSSLMTIAVIGIALALPTGLHVVLKNVQGVSAGWEDAVQISLFLNQGIEVTEARRIVEKISAMSSIEAVVHVTPQQALGEFRQYSGFGDALEVLDENPLPNVLLVRPTKEASEPLLVEPLLHELRNLPSVEMAQLDMEWLKRLYAIMAIGERGVLVLAVLLALAVLLIVGNTIRLAIQNRRDEIEVQKLIGATDAFIQRPFLYSGLWQGVLGAVMAWLLVTLSLWLLHGPVQQLSLLYNSNFSLGSLEPVGVLVVLVAGGLLGLFGAWLAVGRHLRDIEPT